MQFQKGFFEFIAAADAEKVHSQTIGWMFSPNCNAMSPSDKSKLLRLMTNSNLEMKVEKVYVELYDIDILIICNDSFIVIENKIKTGQHSNQLNKYLFLTSEKPSEVSAFKVLKNERDALRKKLSGLNENYIFLSLLNEKSYNGSNNENSSDKWKDVSYKSFVELLDNQIGILNNDHGIIIKSYLETIRNLNSALASIESDKEVIRWIFNNGSLTQKMRFEFELSDSVGYPNKTCQYISESGLVRFAQKYYYKVVCDLVQSSNKLNLEVNATYGSSNKNGGGLIQIDFPEFNFIANGRKYKLGYQVQGKTEKINLADTSYHDAKAKEVELFKMLTGVEEHLDKLKANIKFQRRNPGVSKPYHSISNTLNKETLFCKPSELAEYIIEKINYHKSNLEIFFNTISKK